MKDNYDKVMEKFNKYVQIIVESSLWKRPKNITCELDFLNDVDETAQKYGYKAESFGENEDNRVIKFTKMKYDNVKRKHDARAKSYEEVCEERDILQKQLDIAMEALVLDSDMPFYSQTAIEALEEIEKIK